MKLLKLVVILSLVYFSYVNCSSTQYKKTFLKNFSKKLELDEKPCKSCMQEKEILNNKSLHFPCPQDKSRNCMRCTVNTQRSDLCKVGCFRLVDQGAHPCLIQKDYDNLFKKNKLIKKPKVDGK